MYNNPGKKIKGIANFFGMLGVCASIVWGGTLIINTDKTITGILIIVLGSLSSWFSFLLLYSYGQLIENSDKTVELLKNRLYGFAPTTVDDTSTHSKNEWECKKCGALVIGDYDFCPYCKLLDEENSEEVQLKKTIGQKFTDLMFEPDD